MKFHTVIPYKLKRLIPMAMIAGMPVFAASCDKEPQYHDTTYVWGFNDWSETKFGPMVAASADSANVQNVYLLNDGNALMGAPTTYVLKKLNAIIDMVPPENRSKVRGAGTLHEISILDDQARQDSIKLAKMGFQFGRVFYGSYR